MSRPAPKLRPIVARLPRRLSAVLRVLVLASWIGVPSVVLAEGGSAGGKIGDAPGDSGGGSSGGKIPPPPAEEKPKPRVEETKPEAPERDARRPQRPRDEGGSRRGSREEKKGSGGGGGFDGTWSVHTSSRCGWSSSTPIRISGSHISAAHLSGSVSPSGSVRMVSHYQGLTHTSSGRLSGSSGSGSFSRTDGCSGSWTASR